MLYLYAIKSPATKGDFWILDFGRFLDKDNNLEDKAIVFAKRGRDDRTWAFNSIIRFIQLQKDRFIRKEITAGTIRNYVKGIKLLQMADVSVAWEKITRGLPRTRRYADDRAPSIEEIKKICKYPDPIMACFFLNIFSIIRSRFIRIHYCYALLKASKNPIPPSITPIIKTITKTEIGSTNGASIP